MNKKQLAKHDTAIEIAVGLGMMSRDEGMKEYLSVRPKIVQELAAEFPVGTELHLPAPHGVCRVIGWNEDGMVILIPFAFFLDEDSWNEKKKYVHADCLREHHATEVAQ